jgi:short-subunit dehydrogenase
MKTQNQHILITGASSGIGRALALGYAERHARMVLVARRRDLLEETADMVRQRGGEAVSLVADVADPHTAEQAVELAHSHFGGLDLVIMNAATNRAMQAHNFNAESAEYVTAVNYLGVLRMVAAALPGMLAADHGHLVAVSSLAGYRGMPGASIYNASKAAVTTFMEALRIELRSTGVAVTTISPGFVRTEINANNDFYMPFMLEADDAALRMIRAIDRAASEYRFPLMTSLAVRFLQVLPNPVYDRLIAWARSTGTKLKANTSPSDGQGETSTAVQ